MTATILGTDVARDLAGPNTRPRASGNLHPALGPTVNARKDLPKPESGRLVQLVARETEGGALDG